MFLCDIEWLRQGDLLLLRHRKAIHLVQIAELIDSIHQRLSVLLRSKLLELQKGRKWWGEVAVERGGEELSAVRLFLTSSWVIHSSFLPSMFMNFSLSTPRLTP